MIRGFITGINDGFVFIEQPDRTVTRIMSTTVNGSCHKGDFIIQDINTGSFRVDVEITNARIRDIRRMSEAFFD
jgi:hypothetical protein